MLCGFNILGFAEPLNIPDPTNVALGIQYGFNNSLTGTRTPSGLPGITLPIGYKIFGFAQDLTLPPVYYVVSGVHYGFRSALVGTLGAIVIHNVSGSESSASTESQTESNAKGNSETSESVEVGCWNGIYTRSESETGNSTETALGAGPNPYLSGNTTLGSYAMTMSIDFSDSESELTNEFESGSVYLNGVLVTTPGCGL